MSATHEQVERLRAARPDYHWKVQTANEWGCNCVAYIDARDVMDVLDETVGPGNWREEPMQMVGDRLMATISIKIDGEWVSRTDTGTDSPTEGEKGGVSDAFKRAAVKWGIGRFLYRLSIVKVPAVKNNRGKWVPGDNNKPIYNLTEWIRKMGKDPGYADVRAQQAEPPKPARAKAKQQSEKAEPAEPSNAATQDQLAVITAFAKDLSMTGRSLDAMIKREFGPESNWKNLTRDQADELADKLSIERSQIEDAKDARL